MSTELTIRGEMHPRFEEILTPEALAFVGALNSAFAERRIELLAARRDLQRRINEGEPLDFAGQTCHIRALGTWKVAAPAPGLTDRRVEITGPPTTEMITKAMNSGAKVWMADFEDATAPTWFNLIDGQLNVRDAIRREGVADRPTVMTRPRGWHLMEKHLTANGHGISASLVDFGLYFFHNAATLIAAGAGPYFYLPKLESYLEARLWNDVFVMAQNLLGIPLGTIRATVLIETFTAAFQMDEILYELRKHSAGLNAGQWDYIFSYLRNFAYRGSDHVLPDRSGITMTTPFMRAYTELLVSTCHRRGAHAIGGMAAAVPAKHDADAFRLAMAKVKSDKDREVRDGFDGTWVAHQDLVSTCFTSFDAVLAGRPNQLELLRSDVSVSAADLQSLTGVSGDITMQGLLTNISVSLRYLAAWVGGTGSVAIDGFLEDAATAEISRIQIWQWIATGTRLAEGPVVTVELATRLMNAELARLERVASQSAEDAYAELRNLAAARQIFIEIALEEKCLAFFTPIAYANYLVSGRPPATPTPAGEAVMSTAPDRELVAV